MQRYDEVVIAGSDRIKRRSFFCALPTTMPPVTRKRKATQDALTDNPQRQPPVPKPAPAPRPGPGSIPYEQRTDRALIDKQVDALICPAMANAWDIHGYFQTCILFDAVNPLRQFKRGAEFDEMSDDPFPDYHPRDAADVTETDEEGSLQQYKPMDYTCVQSLRLPAPLSLIYMVISPRYRFECKFSVEVFMSWTEGQLHKITYGKTRKTPRKQEYKWKMKKQKIPVQYARIVHQLTLEDAHGEIDMGHESLRRRTYAQMTLDMFGRELDFRRGPLATFRSKVLSPILQRQLRGIPDAYSPSIRKAIVQRSGGAPTISQVTTMYLGNDPLDPRCIPSYRRNLVYVREALWHLGILMKKNKVGDVKLYGRYLDHHDLIMDSLRGSPSPGTRAIPPFREYEVATLVIAGIDSFFEKELEQTVCITFASISQLVHCTSRSLSSFKMQETLWRNRAMSLRHHHLPCCPGPRAATPGPLAWFDPERT